MSLRINIELQLELQVEVELQVATASAASLLDPEYVVVLVVLPVSCFKYSINTASGTTAADTGSALELE